MKFTIFGGTGFIGRNLVSYLRQQGYEVFSPNRDELINDRKPLGHVIYAIGLTGDFRTRSYDTVEAHVCLLKKLLKSSQFDSWLYLSSTRIYSSLPIDTIANEQTAISIRPQANSLYDLSKMLGESLCLTNPSSNVRVARLSNVYGVGQSKHTFLASLMQDLQKLNQVVINESPDSCKDYVAVNDVLPLLEAIAIQGKKRIYNVASGHLLAHADLAKKLTCLTNSKVVFSSDAVRRIFPLINISEIVTEFKFSPSMLLEDLGGLLNDFKVQFHHGDTF